MLNSNLIILFQYVSCLRMLNFIKDNPSILSLYLGSKDLFYQTDIIDWFINFNNQNLISFLALYNSEYQLKLEVSDILSQYDTYSTHPIHDLNSVLSDCVNVICLFNFIIDQLTEYYKMNIKINNITNTVNQDVSLSIEQKSKLNNAISSVFSTKNKQVYNILIDFTNYSFTYIDSQMFTKETILYWLQSFVKVEKSLLICAEHIHFIFEHKK